MGLRIRTNVASLNAQRRLSNSTDALQSSMQKLSSGERINKAADDAAGLSISENLRADIRSLNQNKRNALDGISLVQVAEGGLEDTGNMLIRLRELSTQASSDTIGQTERQFIDTEFLALKDEIDRIATATEFNGTRLLVGGAQLDGEIANQPGSFPMEVQVGKDYFSGADSLEGPNPVNIVRIDLNSINAFTDGEGSLGLGRADQGVRANTKQAAQLSISTLDAALTKVNGYRSYLGAIQNRFQNAVTNLGTQVENLSEARSRIRDVDFAAESAQFTQNRILQQAGSSVLAQANQAPQVALSLLQNL